MRNKLAIFLGVVVVLSLATNVWSQNPVTADSPFQIRYASNLSVGDSNINMTNSGASNGANICVNVYAFSPDEQLISCCSCVVTPNALTHLSVRNDLISNTLTPAVPDDVTVKLLATTGGACNAAAPGALTSGLLAWGTTIHPMTISETVAPNCSKQCMNNNCNGSNAGSAWCKANCPPLVTTTTGYAMTETPFIPATLSAAELARISSLCGFIQANGSGYGICRSCRTGAE